MSKPLISIIINNYNYCRYLQRAIDSALGQTYPGCEVIVVDDASSDGSAELIRSYRSSIIPLLQTKNSGQGAALNAGFAACRGDVVIFLDSDDYLYPEAASQIISAWKPGSSKAQYRLDLVDAEERFIDLFPAPEVSFDSGDVVPLLLKSGRYESSVTSGNAFARTALVAILPMPEDEFRIAADGYLVTLAPFYGSVLSIEKSLGAYRRHTRNDSRTGEDLGASVRRWLKHDRQKYRVMISKASEFGLRSAADPGLADHAHLSHRVASLRLDPARHPSPGDSLFGLMLRGMWASRDARLPRTGRVLLALWFLSVGLLPQQFACRVVAWRLQRTTRPVALQNLVTMVRRTIQQTS